MRKIIFIMMILFISSCKQEKDKIIEEKKSIHQHDLEKEKTDFANFKLEIVENKILVDKSIGRFRNPQFSIDGKKVFFTTEDFNEIWFYDLSNDAINKLVSLPQCGFNFQISKNGDVLYFRNKVTKGKKSFSILSYEINTKKIDVIYNSDFRLSPPILADSLIYFVENEIPKNVNLLNKTISDAFNKPFFFVENNVLKKVDNKIDTLNIPNNIKPIECFYSKDLENIFVLTNTIGFLLYNKIGEPINIIKDAGFISKLFKSNLLVFTKEKYDDQKLSYSKMFIGFIDSDKEFEILTDEKYQKLYPDWSPTKNKIVFATEYGDIRIITFNITKK
ncbi:MAG: hypothetical protein IPM32_17375 [Ignavibacteriae bacterium]|nr:hypothetical protein [Ignavibacteriota bacterium]